MARLPFDNGPPGVDYCIIAACILLSALGFALYWSKGAPKPVLPSIPASSSNR